MSNKKDRQKGTPVNPSERGSGANLPLNPLVREKPEEGDYRDVDTGNDKKSDPVRSTGSTAKKKK